MFDDIQGDEQDFTLPGVPGPKRKGNQLPTWGNEKTMNINNMILTNIQQSPYYKVNLAELSTYHEIVTEIYNKVDHLEPWEKNSRRTSGQIGMCGGVRGVGAGGIVSSAYCLLYKLFVIKLTRKQLTALINHTDSPYLRGIGLMYIRYCQPPADLWDWFEPYLDDDEEIDPRAGGGDRMMIGQMIRHFLTRLDWYGTLFPRIPVPIQKQIEDKLKERRNAALESRLQEENQRGDSKRRESGERDNRKRSRSPLPRRDGSSSREGQRRSSPAAKRSRSPRTDRRRSRSPRAEKRDRKRSRTPEKGKRQRSQSTGRSTDVIERSSRRADDLAELIEREKVRQKSRHKHRSRSRDRDSRRHRRSRTSSSDSRRHHKKKDKKRRSRSRS